MSKLDNAIIVVTRAKNKPVLDEETNLYFNGERVYAIRKFNPTAKYKNIRSSLATQIKSRYFYYPFLTPGTFEEYFEATVYTFDKRGWPEPVGDLRDWLR